MGYIQLFNYLFSKGRSWFGENSQFSERSGRRRCSCLWCGRSGKANEVTDTKVADAVEGTYAVEGVLQADAMNAHAMNANACNEDAFVCIVCIALSHPLLFFLK